MTKETAITSEVLLALGFESNHPERILGNFYMHSNGGVDWYIRVDSEYISTTNELAYNVNCWKENDNHIITKRVQAGYIKTIGELIDILEICGLVQVSGITNKLQDATGI